VVRLGAVVGAARFPQTPHPIRTMQTMRGVTTADFEADKLKSKVEQLTAKMEAVVGMWWALDGDKLKVAVTVTKQPHAFAKESCKKQFQPDDSSAVARVFTTKQQIWMPRAKNDTTYHRKDLAAQFNICSIGLIHMDGGVFEYAFEAPRENPPILLHLSGEPIEEDDRAYEDADEGVIRWSESKKMVLLSPAERKRRRLESNRAAAKRAYYRRQNKCETISQDNSQLREQLDEERSKVEIYENLLRHLGINPEGAVAVIKAGRQGQALPTKLAIAPAGNQSAAVLNTLAVVGSLAIPSAPKQLKARSSQQQQAPTLNTSASCPTLRHTVPTVYAKPAAVQLQTQAPTFTAAPTVSTFNFSQPVVSSGSSSVAPAPLGLATELPMQQAMAVSQTNGQQRPAELAAGRQEAELMSLQLEQRPQLSGAAASFSVNSTSASAPNLTAVGAAAAVGTPISSSSQQLWMEDMDINDVMESSSPAPTGPPDYSSAPEYGSSPLWAQQDDIDALDSPDEYSSAPEYS
jgi:hypothetical protein